MLTIDDQKSCCQNYVDKIAKKKIKPGSAPPSQTSPSSPAAKVLMMTVMTMMKRMIRMMMMMMMMMIIKAMMMKTLLFGCHGGLWQSYRPNRELPSLSTS